MMGSPDWVASPTGAASMADVPFARHDKVRMAFIGVGGRGMSLLRDCLAVPNVEVVAVCDIVSERVKAAQKRVVDAGQAEPKGFDEHDRHYEDLCKLQGIDLIYIATPWDWHVPMAVAAMEAGKHVGLEVPAATTIDDCWKLVDTSERTRKHCVILENCCYGWSEMLVLNMVRQGALGELTHGEAAYIHDLRSLLLEDHGEGLWRRKPHTEIDGNLYPTHGLGPVANYMDVNRGDLFAYMVSMSSHEKNLTHHRDKTIPDGHHKREEKYVCGDMNTSLIKTANGRSIMLQHDVVSPRPYDRINLISGTKGTFRDYPARIYIEGETPNHNWEDLDRYREKFEHPLWSKQGELARRMGGHGGMDYIMSFRLIQCMLEGLPPDMDVYDAAAWSAPFPLSVESVAKGSAPVAFPDFTRGRWKQPRVRPYEV